MYEDGYAFRMGVGVDGTGRKVVRSVGSVGSGRIVVREEVRRRVQKDEK